MQKIKNKKNKRIRGGERGGKRGRRTPLSPLPPNFSFFCSRSFFSFSPSFFRSLLRSPSVLFPAPATEPAPRTAVFPFHWLWLGRFAGLLLGGETVVDGNGGEELVRDVEEDGAARHALEVGGERRQLCAGLVHLRGFHAVPWSLVDIRLALIVAKYPLTRHRPRNAFRSPHTLSRRNDHPLQFPPCSRVLHVPFAGQKGIGETLLCSCVERDGVDVLPHAVERFSLIQHTKGCVNEQFDVEALEGSVVLIDPGNGQHVLYGLHHSVVEAGQVSRHSLLGPLPILLQRGLRLLRVVLHGVHLDQQPVAVQSVLKQTEFEAVDEEVLRGGVTAPLERDVLLDLLDGVLEGDEDLVEGIDQLVHTVPCLHVFAQHLFFQTRDVGEGVVGRCEQQLHLL
eukprot:Sspe_Gene.105453::Locus_82495_Transcript_1_1_Confidence_1.000_Length_2077::g.105453::m.105453